VLFLANELAAGSLANKRAAVRALHGTAVRFRPDGFEESEIGFTYNISTGGLYVRTLAPPSEDIVWLELLPPRSTRRVQLVGQVVWRRPFGPHKKATVPPGFGCRIIDAPRSSLDRWHEAVSSATLELGEPASR
jgi:Tfp pilus assembly protein PilZ